MTGRLSQERRQAAQLHIVRNGADERQYRHPEKARRRFEELTEAPAAVAIARQHGAHIARGKLLPTWDQVARLEAIAPNGQRVTYSRIKEPS